MLLADKKNWRYKISNVALYSFDVITHAHERSHFPPSPLSPRQTSLSLPENTNNLSLSNRIVDWLRQDRGMILNATILTVIAVAGGILLVVTFPLSWLSCTVCETPSNIFTRYMELGTAENYIGQRQQQEQAMVDLINETLDFDSLPTFVPNRNTHYRSNFMHVPSSELTAPIMKGVDHDNRPFLLFKYHLRSTGELNQFAWSTMLLGSTYAPLVTYKSSEVTYKRSD